MKRLLALAFLALAGCFHDYGPPACLRSDTLRTPAPSCLPIAIVSRGCDIDVVLPANAGCVVTL